jgi:ribosomal protein S18 acetylase RimI-like enzyme
MTRLYVRPSFRRQSLGRRLAEAILAAACGEKYKFMRLDTLQSMHDAIALYESLGFQRIPAYYDNPIPGVVFFELALR